MTTPNWKIRENYDATLSPQGWAWEFLRRNPDYRADWHRYRKVCDQWGEYDEALINCPTMDVWDCEPPALPGETETQWEVRVGTIGSRTSLRASITGRWGLLATPQDPDVPGTSGTDLFFDYGQWLKMRRGPASVAHELEFGDVSITFDLKLPVLPQIKRANKYLRETQQWLMEAKGLQARVDRPKYTPTKLIEYLRVLDARSADAQPSEIIATLYPTKDNSYPGRRARIHLTQTELAAVALRDGDYRDLTLMQLRRRTSKKISTR